MNRCYLLVGDKPDADLLAYAEVVGFDLDYAGANRPEDYTADELRVMMLGKDGMAAYNAGEKKFFIIYDYAMMHPGSSTIH